MDKVYIQIYSVRDPLLKDYVGSLKKLSEIGYDGIEYAISYGGMNPAEMKKLLAELNLDPISSHVGLDKAVADIPYMAEIGGRYIICPSARFNNKEEALRTADKLNEIGKECAKYGLKYGYHNHTQEFAVDGGKYLLEHLIDNTDPANVVFELDVGWCETAGVDAASFIQKHAGRFELIHAKEAGKVVGVKHPIDMTKVPRDENGRPVFTEEQKQIMADRQRMNVPTGKGIFDWKKVKEVADAQGAKAYIVEREWDYLDDIFACVKEDYEYLKKNV